VRRDPGDVRPVGNPSDGGGDPDPGASSGLAPPRPPEHHSLRQSTALSRREAEKNDECLLSHRKLIIKYSYAESIDKRLIKDQAFLLSCLVDSAPRPSRSPLARQQVVSLSQSSYVSPVELTDRRGGRGTARKPVPL